MGSVVWSRAVTVAEWIYWVVVSGVPSRSALLGHLMGSTGVF